MNKQYTAERDSNCDFSHEAGWAILDPDGDWICTVQSKEQAASLISHLNRVTY